MELTNYETYELRSCGYAILFYITLFYVESGDKAVDYV